MLYNYIQLPCYAQWSFLSSLLSASGVLVILLRVYFLMPVPYYWRYTRGWHALQCTSKKLEDRFPLPLVLKFDDYLKPLPPSCPKCQSLEVEECVYCREMVACTPCGSCLSSRTGYFSCFECTLEQQ